MLKKDELRFLIIGNNFDWTFPKSIAVRPTAKILTRKDGSQLELNLFEFVPEEDFNETEKAVAWYLENQRRLFFWYRNRSRHDYSIQGWRSTGFTPTSFSPRQRRVRERTMSVFTSSRRRGFT